ncbi:MAG: transposase family protein [Sulfuricurvum sp.]|nr:transposase family protein [Sulfuricurvum sp.]
MSTESRIIKYISFCDGGSLHDYRQLKEAFPPQENWFKNVAIKVDLGYAGIIKDYLCKSISIPHKKTKNNPLKDTQKDENTRMASVRIKVEHSIGGMKRYRILSDRLRNHLIDLYDDILGVCAGLWNFYLAN